MIILSILIINLVMANLPEETLMMVVNLLPRLFTVINLATATEHNLFEQYGETEATVYELQQIKNAGERGRLFYNRLYGLVLQIAESQPVANPDTIRLLYQSIEQAQLTADAVEATAQETKRSWNLP